MAFASWTDDVGLGERMRVNQPLAPHFARSGPYYVEEKWRCVILRDRL